LVGIRGEKSGFVGCRKRVAARVKWVLFMCALTGLRINVDVSLGLRSGKQRYWNGLYGRDWKVGYGFEDRGRTGTCTWWRRGRNSRWTRAMEDD
jgi:hypothetical protein